MATPGNQKIWQLVEKGPRNCMKSAGSVREISCQKLKITENLQNEKIITGNYLRYCGKFQ
jgi:hypothetical protein